MLFLTVIMMAFLVAVVTRSYERWTMKYEAQTYRQRTQMICERESIMTEEELKNPDYFPTHILVRKPKMINTEDSEGNDTFSVVNEVNQNTQALHLEMVKTLRSNNNDL